MNFSEFATLCYDLEKTASRLTKVDLTSRYLKELKSDEIRTGVAFLSGRAFPLSDPRTLDLGPAAFARAREAEQSEFGPPLTLTEVGEAFGRIAEAGGKVRAAKNTSACARSSRAPNLMNVRYFSACCMASCALACTMGSSSKRSPERRAAT